MGPPGESGDSAVLALLGKKQVLKRRFGFVSLFAFAVCELVTWETVLALFSQGLINGGPAGLVYGFIIAWSSTLSVYTVISELASMAPIAAGQYYWVYMLANPNQKTVLSYVVGWLTTLAWIATVAIETLFAGTMLQGILIIDYDNYHSQRYQGTMLTWGIILTCIFINVVIPNWLPRFEVFIVVFHLAGFIAITAALWATTPHIGSNASVWLTSLNEGGWSSQGLSYCVGFLGNVATFVGADASVHLAEEVSNAALNIPRAILAAMCINGLIGFSMMVTTLYCLGDIKHVLGGKTEFPFIQVFLDSVGNTAGASVMVAIVLALTWAASVGITTTASRMTWSFSRDNGLPGSRWISQVHSRTKIPTNAVMLVSGLSALLTLIYIGSDVAFNDVVSLTITGFYGSYLLPASLLLYRRIKGQILPYGGASNTNIQPASTAITNDHPGPSHLHTANSNLQNDVEVKLQQEDKTSNSPPGYHSEGSMVHEEIAHGIVVANAELIWGPWHLPGWLGTLNNAYAVIYMVFVIFWSVWPPATPVTAATMNYSVVVTGGIAILSTVWYFARAKHEYKGPLVDDEVAPVMRRGSAVAVP